MLEDQVAYLLQKYLGNYVRGLNKEALKISVWQGNVELTNMQLKPEALNALKLPVRVKAGFLGSVKLKVPWSRLGQDPVVVHLDRIFLLAEPATSVEGCSEDAVQEAKRSRVREMEMKLLERSRELKSEMNKSWLGSLINTIIGNLKLSISNIHIRYEDLESNPGHPFAAGLSLDRLSAVTIDDSGSETFVTGGLLDQIQKSVELNQLALYMDSDISPWHIDKPWEDMLPDEWVQVFRFGTKDGKPASHPVREHTYVLQPVTGNARYLKSRERELSASREARQKAAVNLDDVTLCLSKNGYRDILKLADNFASFNERLKYAHYRPVVSVASDPRSWWKCAYQVVSEQIKKASGKLSWEQVLRYATLRKQYISLYASLLKSDMSLEVVDDNEEIKELDRGLDIELILQWRMLAHKFLEQSTEPRNSMKRQKSKKSWWSFGWSSEAVKDESESFHLSEEDWEQLNRMIGYKEDNDEPLVISNQRPDVLQTLLEIHVKRNATKLLDEAEASLAELSSEGLDCSVKLYPETKVVNVKLESYQLSCPTGLLVESATSSDSLVGVFHYKPFDAKVDWSLVAKASPCYATYLKDSIDGIIKFFESNTAVSQTIALETAAAVQMTIDGVKRSAQQQVNRALKDHSRFSLDLDIAAPKITIPTEFQPDENCSTKLLLDLGNLVIRSKDDHTRESEEEMDIYLQFDMVLSDVSALLVDGDYTWNQTSVGSAVSIHTSGVNFFPVIDKCGVILKIQQMRSENLSFPSTRLAIRLPSLGFHFSPARYHRLMQVVKIFQEEDNESSDVLQPWDQADFEGWLSVLTRKGMGNREAVWQRRYVCLVGPFIYMLESPGSKSYRHRLSLRGKQIYQVPLELVGEVESVLAVCDAAQTNNRNVIEDVNALILQCETDESTRVWKSRLQRALYHASVSVPIAALPETSSDDSETELSDSKSAIELSRLETLFLTGFLDELNVNFCYNCQGSQHFTEVLLGEESPLFLFRAIGGQVELLMKGSDLFVGTVLKSLEIEDLVCRNDGPCYLARSFLRSADAQPSLDDASRNKSPDSDNLLSSGSEEQFYEASGNLVDVVDNSAGSPHNISEFLSSQKNTFRTPSFHRIEGLLPVEHPSKEERIGLDGALDSFVRAQVVIYDQNSPSYRNTDTQVSVTLATLSFFCRRPTVIAVMEFVNAINADIERCESFSDDSSAEDLGNINSREQIADDQPLAADEYRVVKGFLGKGKSRVVFNLTLDMTHAEILLMTENEKKLATLSQENLVTDIKVFPSSFSIKASLGNLRISDESLPNNHMYFWICDMRDPGGTSFVELLFSSFSADDEDYEGYEYSLSGQLSEVRIVYLNRFVQEIVGYFVGLVPNDSKNVVKYKDQLTNSEKWFTTDEFEGSPALKLDLSLEKPIILMPRRTDSQDYLKLDVVHITVQNTFKWLCGNKNDMNAVRLEIMTVQVADINLNVGIGSDIGESIIQDVEGVSVVIERSLRDLMHQLPSIETTVKVEKLRAALSNKEYQVVTECALSNISEAPNALPSLNNNSAPSSVDVVEPVTRVQEVDPTDDTWIVMKVSVIVDLVELCLYSGFVRDVSLATVQATGAWLLYKSNTLEEGSLLASLKGFSVIDDREGTKDEFRLAIGTSEKITRGSLYPTPQNEGQRTDEIESKGSDAEPFPTMLILDAGFGKSSTSVSVCIQRPQLLVALDFLLAVVEFFVPTVSNLLVDEENKSLHIKDAIILDQPIFWQPAAEISLSPLRPLIVDDEKYDHFIYDGNGGILHLRDRRGAALSAPSEPIVYVDSGKRLQFKNVIIKNGHYLDSCVSLGTDSSYSASEDDHVFVEEGDEGESSDSGGSAEDLQSHINKAPDFIINFQAVSPELTFYTTSKEVGESPILSNRLLHAQLDAFGRLVLKDDTIEVTAKALGLTVESNGVRILEPFDTFVKYSNASGKTNISLSVSDIFMNFSFSILRLFLLVEDEILAFLRTKSKEMIVVCSEFDRVGMIKSPNNDQLYTFWRPLAPSGFAVLGDYLTPMDKPPSKGVLAINTQYIKVKRPKSFKLIWSPVAVGGSSDQDKAYSESSSDTRQSGDSYCSVWFPEAPEGYIALGCVVSPGKEQPLPSCTFCVMASFVSRCSLRDCVTISCSNICPSTMAFWRVNNSLGSFLPSDSATLSLLAVPYELRLVKFGFSSPKASVHSDVKATAPGHGEISQADRSAAASSSEFYGVVASFRLIWWNRGLNARKRLSVWRPEVPEGMVYFGDIAVNGYEPPNTCVVLREMANEELFRAPVDFQMVGQIKKQRGMETISFWQPEAPPGFVPLGCIACKGSPKQYNFGPLRCIRSDMVSGDQFLEESLWDTTDTKVATDQFSVWTVGNELGTFVVRGGFRKPPRRFALRLANLVLHSGSDDTVVDAEIRTLSVALFDDYGGLVVPLFNLSMSGIGFSLHGRTDYLNSAVSFSLAARSYNDKYESWEPLIEPVDGFLRYQYDPSTPGAGSQLRFTSTRDLNLNISVSNANMVFQAYASWNNLNHINEYPRRKESPSPNGGRSAVDVHQKRSYYLMPQNKLGQDIFIRATEMQGLSSVVRMPSGDVKPIKVPVSLNMLDSHLNAEFLQKSRAMVTVTIVDAEVARVEGLASHQYTVHMCLSSDHSPGSELLLDQQSARTCGRFPEGHIPGQTIELINWNEIYFFKIDSSEQYNIEFILSDMGKGDAIGYFVAPLYQIAKDVHSDSGHDDVDSLMWVDLLPRQSLNTPEDKKACGRLRVAVLVSSRYTGGQKDNSPGCRKSAFIQISPSIGGPWTPVRLNYAAPSACWRLGNDAVASEVSIKEGNRYVTIRSLVSVRNNTEFVLQLNLAPKANQQKIKAPAHASTSDSSNVENKIQMDEVFETEKYEPTIGWINFSAQQHSKLHGNRDIHQDLQAIQLPRGWEWIDDWHLDTSSVHAGDGWAYAPNVEGLNWPESNDSLKYVNHGRQRRWIRHRKLASRDAKEEMLVGQLKPGEVMPLPLSGLSQPGLYILQMRPSSLDMGDGYSWSTVVKSDWSHDSRMTGNSPDISVSALVESEELLYCSLTNGTSVHSSCGKIWFCVSIQATEIAKDVNSNPIQDWTIVVKSPFSITNYLPFKAEYSILEMRESGHFSVCSRGIISSEQSVKSYNADIRKPLFLSLVPQWGWLPVHEAVLISHPDEAPSKTMSLRSSVTGRIVQLILDQNYNTEKVVLAKSIRIYAPYWLSVARCPPLKYKLQELTGKMPAKRIGIPFRSRSAEVNYEEITDQEIYNGYTIASALNFKVLGLSVSIAGLVNEQFGPVKELSRLGDMDGSIDVDAYDGDGRCLRLFISVKPCSYQSVPTKVITVRPHMTFTNRIGQDLFIKLNSEDESQVLHAYDARISFVRSDCGADKLQVRLVDTEWSFPVQITKEDTIFLVLRKPNGKNLFLRMEIRGYEEGSRFVVVFRPESADGPIRIENHTSGKTISIRQSGFSENAWTSMQPLSTAKFSWEDPYGQKCMDVRVDGESGVGVWRLDFESAETCPTWNEILGMQFHVVEIGHIKVARFTDERKEALTLHEGYGRLAHTEKSQNSATSFEVIIELGVVGVSVVDHRPKELSYVYLERVFMSYSTGYDGGNTSRFKLIMGYLQIDNQLPLSLMPVLLAPEENGDVLHPLFKMTVTVRNESIDGVLIYPYVYIRVTDKCWRLNIHEPIIWALVEFYGNLQLDRIPKSPSVTQVDPEIHFNLIDVSEVRLKVSMETAPAQRPRGVLGVWSPVMSAIGNAFKIQVHLRRVMHRDRFMRQSSIVPAIGSRIWRDLIHNPLHLLFSVDVLGMTSSTLASLGKGFAELSTDGQFLQLRSKQVSSRRITGVGDGIIQGTEALAQGFAFGVSGVVRKPVESARQHGFLGLAQGFGRAFVGFIVQPVSGALDFFSLTVDGIGASCSRCFEVLSDTTVTQRIRNPRAIRADGVLTEYFEKDAVGQMVLHLAEASRRFGCTKIFKEPSKFALSDYYEEHFVVPHQRIVLVTNKRVMLLQCSSLDKMDRRPSKILWDIPWEELMALELAKAGFEFPSHLILHLKKFRRSENFVRVIKCNVEVDGREPQAVKICSVVRKMWKAYLCKMTSIMLKVPASQRYVSFSSANSAEPASPRKTIIKSREPSSSGHADGGVKFVKHSVNFQKIWSSERELKSRCSLCNRQASQNDGICSIWRPMCPDGYVSIGDIARIGSHPPNVAAVYRNDEKLFALPVGYDLVWRNCPDDYQSPVSIWYPRAPEGFVSLGCVAVAGFMEPEVGLTYCIADSIAEETVFEEQKIWSAPDSYPWGCHIYQVLSDALHFVALRQRKEETPWKPMRVVDDDDRQPLLQQPSEN